MKLIAIFFFLTISISSYSQKTTSFKGRKKPYNCENIIKVNNELSGKSEQRLPNEFILSPINLSYIKTNEAEVKLLSFYIERYPYSSTSKGVYIKLENGDVLKYPETKVRSSYSGGSYSLSGGFIMDEELIKKLKENFIVQFSMGDQIIEIDELHCRNLKVLFNCMFKD